MAQSPFWLGGLAASMAACCTHPLDLVKVRMQTLDPRTATKPPSTSAILRAIVTTSGLRSLYTGLSASLMRQMTYSLVRFGSYQNLKRQMAVNTQPTTTQLLVAAGVAGGLGGVAGNPADIVLVRMVNDSIRPPEQRYRYKNAFNGFVSLVKEEGIRGLTRGLGTNSARAVLMNVSQLGSYDYFKAHLIHRSLPFTNYRLRDNIVLHIIASCLAGTVATTICSPADVLKSRLMSSSRRSLPWEIFTQSLRDEGIKFISKGWTPAFIRLGSNTVLLFVFFEQLKRWQTYATATF